MKILDFFHPQSRVAEFKSLVYNFLRLFAILMPISCFLYDFELLLHLYILHFYHLFVRLLRLLWFLGEILKPVDGYLKM